MTSRALILLGALGTTPVLAQPNVASEPRIERRVIEDDAVRIEELRVRGQTQRIVVQPKKGALQRPYEVLPADAGLDPSQGRSGQSATAGKRVWQVLTF